MFSLSFLHNFISLDPVSGQQVNKLSGKQLMNTENLQNLYEEILSHQDNIVDLYSIFMRTQVIKKDWPKKDYKFSIMSDLCEAEIEIEDCKRVIDFTRCSYSINHQDKIHLIIENTQSKT